MKIKFYGTSHGLPEKTRYCSCAMLEVSDKKYIIDAGAPFSTMLIQDGIKLAEINAIFITHMHGDHMDGLPEFVDLVSWYYKVDTKIFLPDERTIPALTAWNSAMNPGKPVRADMIAFEAGVIYEDDTVKVTAIKTQHITNSYAFLFEGEGKRVLFSGDLSGKDVESFDFCNAFPYDAIVCEDTHIEMSMIAKKLVGKDVKKLILNHISPSKERDIEDVNVICPSCNAVKAEDGMEIQI